MAAKYTTSTTEGDTETDETCHLYKLPPELRLCIYQHVMQDIQFHTSSHLLGLPDSALSVDHPPILRVNKILRAETMPVYFDKLYILLKESYEKRQTSQLQYQQCVTGYGLKQGGNGQVKLGREYGRLDREAIRADRRYRRQLQVMGREHSRLRQEGFRFKKTAAWRAWMEAGDVCEGRTAHNIAVDENDAVGEDLNSNEF